MIIQLLDGSVLGISSQQIDQRGNLDFFGMTAGKLPENPTDGFKEWIEYALQSNPNITIFLSIPPIDFPEDWDQNLSASKARGQDIGRLPSGKDKLQCVIINYAPLRSEIELLNRKYWDILCQK